MKKNIAMNDALAVATPADPMLRTQKITIEGKEYTLCFDYGALIEAESYINASGGDVNLLMALDRLNGSSSRILFGMSLHRFHPEIPYADALKLVDMDNALPIANAVASAWSKSMAKSEGGVKNPTQSVE